MTSMQQIVLSLTAFVGLALAGTALARSPRGRLRWSFGLGMAAMAVEALAALALAEYTDSPGERLLWLRLYVSAGLLLLVPWTLFTLALATPWWRPLPATGRRVVLGLAAAAVGLAVAAWHPTAFEVSELEGPFYAVRLGTIGRLAATLQLLSTVAILAGLEAALRMSRGEARWRTKYLVLGLGGIFLARFYFLSQTSLFNVLLVSYMVAMAATFLVGSALVAVSLGRDRLGIELSVSRDVVYRSVAVGVLGLYLFAVGGLGWLFNRLGMPEELVWGSVVVFVSALALAAVMLSEAVRWRIKRFLAVNVYRSKYDYRAQWTHFTTRLGSLVTVEELAPEILQAVADAIGTKTGLLFLRDPADGRYHPVAALGLKRPDSALAADSSLLAMVGPAHAPQILGDGCGGTGLEPAAMEAFGQGAVLVPLPWRGGLGGIMLVGPERTGTPYTGEDVEFLATVAQQGAAALATAQLSETLTRAREFEAFHRLTSFVMHDLKNSIAALSMLSSNALKHFDDPEFQRDAVRTLARTVDRMKGLLGRLSDAPDAADLRVQPVDLVEVALEAVRPLLDNDRITVVKDLAPVPPISGDADALLRVVQNLVSNAAQSITGNGTITLTTSRRNDGVLLSVTDTGCGMSEEFVRKSLFSPFRTTKKGGWGIGLYQAKGIVEAHGGTIEVSSAEGTGTTFRVSLPVAGGGRG